MAALALVPGFDAVEHRIASCGKSFPDRISQFRFLRAEETLDDGVVPTIAFPTHALLNAVCSENRTKVFARILAAAIRAKEHSACESPIPDRGYQSVDHQAPIHGQLHRPPNHASREQIEDNGEIKPPFSRRQVRDVASPNSVRTPNYRNVKVSSENIFGDRQRVIRVRGLTESTGRNARNRARFHQAPDAAFSDVLPSLDEFFANAKATIRPAVQRRPFGPDTRHSLRT